MSCHLRVWRGGSCGQNKSNDWTDNMNEKQAKRLFDEFYDREERLVVTEQSVRRWINTEQLAAYKVGHDWPISEEDFARFLSERRRGGPHD